LLSEGATYDERRAAGPAGGCYGPSVGTGGCAGSGASGERLTESIRILLKADHGGVFELARDFGVIDGNGRGVGSARLGEQHLDRWGPGVRDWRRHRRKLASASCERQDHEEELAFAHGVHKVGHIMARDALKIRRARAGIPPATS
jgi:hypothetical protein